MQLSMPFCFGAFLLIAACGSRDLAGDLEKGVGANQERRPAKKTTTPETTSPDPDVETLPANGGCVDEIPAEVTAEQIAYDAAATAARNQLYADALADHGMTPVTLDSQFDRSQNDPFPSAIPHLIGGTDTTAAVRTYEIFHGFGDKATVYETEAESQSYFMLDYLGYDGTGKENAVMMLDRASPTKSLHAWHVSPDNELMRIKQLPEVEIVRKVRICGCAPGYVEVDDLGAGVSAGSMAPPSEGIFRLPGTATPTLLQTEELKYPIKKIEFESVPPPGKRCERYDPMVAC